MGINWRRLGTAGDRRDQREGWACRKPAARPTSRAAGPSPAVDSFDSAVDTGTAVLSSSQPERNYVHNRQVLQAATSASDSATGYARQAPSRPALL
ncbi:hypothetical protein SKAU_G00038490 [Synaphobranchus kaupii]|uniref:Uncharacterized protein n=1 Tax=Synaphobranchus kaupii TaxID=118154 RepID=A0A9Q1GF01_SYNKA|nr:hypothetical protein SKAU_G00038490 [Synaphobranchus kaupii]